MKILMLLGSFILGNAKALFKNPGEALTQQIILNIRALTVVILSSIGGLALFCCGIYMLVSNVATQLDAGGPLQATATLIVASSLSLISLGVMIFSLRAQTWLRATGFQNASAKKSKQTSPIESAIALLVMDFIKERERQRERPDKTSSQEHKN